MLGHTKYNKISIDHTLLFVLKYNNSCYYNFEKNKKEYFL